MDEAEDLIEAATELADELEQIGIDTQDAVDAAANLVEAAAAIVREAQAGNPVGILLQVVLVAAGAVPDIIEQIGSIRVRLPWDREPSELRAAARVAESEGKTAKAKRLRRKARRRSA